MSDRSRRKSKKTSHSVARMPVDHDQRVAAMARDMNKAIKKSGAFDGDMEANIKISKNGVEIKIQKPLTGLRKTWDTWVVKPYEAFNKLTISTTGAVLLTGAVLAGAVGQGTTTAEAGNTPERAPHSDVMLETGKEAVGEVLKSRFGVVPGTIINAFLKAAYSSAEQPAAPVKKAEAKAVSAGPVVAAP